MKPNEKSRRQLMVYDKVAHRSRYGQYSIVPFINLSGRWLEQAGFAKGDFITVDVKDGQLTITKTFDDDKPKAV